MHELLLREGGDPDTRPEGRVDEISGLFRDKATLEEKLGVVRSLDPAGQRFWGGPTLFVRRRFAPITRVYYDDDDDAAEDDDGDDGAGTDKKRRKVAADGFMVDGEMKRSVQKADFRKMSTVERTARAQME